MRYPFNMTTLPYTAMKSRRIFFSCFTTFLFLQGCATKAPIPPPSTVQVDNQPSELAQARQQITQLSTRVQDLETRLTAMNDKINSKINPELDTKVIQPHASVGKTIPVVKSKSKDANEEAMVQDDASDRYREAKILFDSNRYSDSVIELSEFVKNFPHHAFAPGAQYFLGMAYHKLKEFKLAEEELSRGLISYPHSQYTADSLRALMEVSDQLKKPEKVTYFEQRLLMLFPNAPQAKGLAANNIMEKPQADEEAAAEPAATPFVKKAKPYSAPMKAAPAIKVNEPTVDEGEETQ